MNATALNFNKPSLEEYNVIHKKTGRMPMDAYINKHYPEFYKHLYTEYSKFTQNIKEMLYLYYNNLAEPQKCATCGKYTTFLDKTKGYSPFCCPTCAQKHTNTRNKAKKTCLERYGVDYTTQLETTKAKAKKTCLERYGVDNVAKLETTKAKAKKTCLERYGVENGRLISDYDEKYKRTCLAKYGTENYWDSDHFKKNIQKKTDKYKQNFLIKYGVESPMQLDAIKEKVQQTCLEKYGVLWNCMRGEAHNSHNTNSKPNLKFEAILKSLNIEYSKEYPIENKIFDFKIGNTLIEVNPSPTHNMNWNPFNKKLEGIDRTYHINKSTIARKHGFNCIHVWDWDDINKIVNSFLPKEKIQARKCVVKIADKKECDTFLNTYHYQNTCRSQKIRIGLYYNDELVQIMTFGKPRYNKKYEFELLRLCTKHNCIIIGGAEKLFSYFITTYKPNTIITYCDNSKFDGAIYEKLGFSLLHNAVPSIHWYNIKTNQHFTDNTIRKYGVDILLNTNFGKNTSNVDLLLEFNFVQVPDCGQKTLTYTNNGLLYK